MFVRLHSCREISVHLHPELRFFWGLYKGKGRQIALSVVLSCLQSVALLPVALLVNTVIDKAIPKRDFSALLVAIVEIFTFAFLGGIVQLLNRRVSIRIIKSTIADLRIKLIKSQLQGSRKYYSREDLDTLHSRIVQDTFRVDSMSGSLLTQTIPGALVTLGLFLVLLKLNLVLGLICAVVSPLFAVTILYMSRRLKVLIKVFHSDFSRYSKGVKFVLGSNELIRISTAESFEGERQSNAVQDLRISHGAALWFSSVLHVSQQQLLMLCGAVILLIGGYFVINNTLSLGELIAFYAALGMLNGNARSVVESVPTLVEGFESLRVLRSIMVEAHGEGEKGTKKGNDGSAVISKGIEHEIRDTIVFENVSFRYQRIDPGKLPEVGIQTDENNATLLDKIDFTIHIGRNEIVNISGLSGSGKSTLMYLLLGFYTPDSGRILVDGIELKSLSLPTFRRQVGVVLQDPLIFAGTIRENLVYGLESFNEAEIAKACCDAMIYEDILQLEKGFDTMIGESGMTLSGGQRQRLAIARALLRKPKLLILDEPTNHLDESLIQEMARLWSHSDGNSEPGRACIVISHDKILRESADSSYILKDGKIKRSAGTAG